MHRDILFVFNTNCNMRCPYCFVDTNHELKMDPDTFNTVHKAVGDFIEYSAEGNHRSNLHVDYFGGEPLLEYGMVLDSMKILSERGKRNPKLNTVWFQVLTNGTANLQRFYELVVENNLHRTMNFKIAWDGPPWLSDTPKTSEEPIEYLKGVGANFGVTVVFGRHNAHNFIPIVDRLYELGLLEGASLKFDSIEFDLDVIYNDIEMGIEYLVSNINTYGKSWYPRRFIYYYSIHPLYQHAGCGRQDFALSIGPEGYMHACSHRCNLPSHILKEQGDPLIKCTSMEDVMTFSDLRLQDHILYMKNKVSKTGTKAQPFLCWNERENMTDEYMKKSIRFHEMVSRKLEEVNIDRRVTW